MGHAMNATDSMDIMDSMDDIWWCPVHVPMQVT